MIDKESFYALKPGDSLVNFAKERWPIKSNNPVTVGSSDVPGEREIVITDPDGNEWVVGWSDDEGKILDEEYADVLELNQSATTIKKANVVAP